MWSMYFLDENFLLSDDAVTTKYAGYEKANQYEF